MVFYICKCAFLKKKVGRIKNLIKKSSIEQGSKEH